MVSTLSDSDIEAYICVRMQAWCSVTSISSDAIYVCDALVVVVVVVIVVVVVVVVVSDIAEVVTPTGIVVVVNLRTSDVTSESEQRNP